MHHFGSRIHATMSSPRLSNRKQKYEDRLWSTYITEHTFSQVTQHNIVQIRIYHTCLR